MLKIHKQRKAEQDLLNIWLYTFENWGVNQADSYLDQIEGAIKSIAVHPNLGINVDKIRKTYKKYHVKQHIVFFKVTKTKIQVVRVLNNAMDYLHHLE